MGQLKITKSTPELVNKGGAQGTCEDPAGPKMFQDVKWGVTNPLGSSANTPVFSNSSTTNQQALSRVAREIYSPNIISEATTFPGVVMRSEETKNSPRKPFLKRLFSLWKKRVGDLDMEYVYKVYMPHLECRGRPEDKDSPRVDDYLDVFASAVAVGPNNDSGKQTTLQQIPDETPVLVTFYDLEELSMPLIVEVVGQPPTLGFFSGFGDAFGSGAGSSRDQFRGGTEGGSPGNSGGPSAPVEREAYTPSSSGGNANGKKATYTGVAGGPMEVRNASLPPELLETVRFNGDEFVALRDMVPDLLALKAKYEEVFRGQGHDLFRVNNAYRDYAWQSRLYNDNCSGGTCSPPTASPGRSRHGWGAAVDLRSRIMFGSSTSSLKFRWLNKYAQQFNFVFSVSSEAWHLNWIPVNTVLAGAGQPTGPWTSKGLDSGPADLRIASINNPGGSTV
jgi:hypothetical protein